MAESWTRILKKIDDWRWEIPVSYKPGMRVPGRIYADERMLRMMGEGEDQAFEQVANVATLPGIVGHSLAMPDIHWGYGFPVGGVAGFDAEEGMISPGGIGFDINCLYGDATVIHEFGYHRRIADFHSCWRAERIRCVNPHTELKDTEILAFIKVPNPAAQVFKLVTETGREIVATGDHPFLTPSGMVQINDLSPGQHVSVYPFEGVPYETPSDEVLITEDDVRAVYPGHPNGLTQLLKVLRAKGLLPMRMNHPKLPNLTKLAGFVQGDGSLQFLKNGGALLAFYGTPEDLEAIRCDIKVVGFIPSRIYRRNRSHTIQTKYGRVEFDSTESFVHTGSSSLAVLLHCLGTTAGNKTRTDFKAPAWLDRAPRWIKRLYLAALFGAELASPKTVSGHPFNFYAPILSLNKRKENVASGLRYLEKIRDWLLEFGVESTQLPQEESYVNRDGQISMRLRVQISSRPENLIRLWSHVGFEYNRRKHYLANVAAQYLRLKCLVLEERKASVESAKMLHKSGRGVDDIVAAIGSPHVDESFVSRSLWKVPRQEVRIGTSFPDFGTFLELGARGLGETGQVWDRVVRKESVPFDGPVYDFTVKDPNHNFIANSFVVSNCGVRLIRTDLTEGDVRPKLTELVDVLFHTVPSGVGVGGRVKVGMGDIDDVLARGARWAVGKGYGVARDLDVIEAGGALSQADPGAVSDQAKKRGRGQVGTLGSGNHFLEVQVVEQIFDAVAAGAMRIAEPGQVVVFIHSGSRGLGHQVCTDYLRVCERVQTKYGIRLVDRQLACVPLKSDEGQQYFGAMSAAANFAFANRQLITHWARESFERVFGRGWEQLGIDLVYDVAHNIGKLEEYEIDGKRRRVCVHRKGATRAFPAGHPEVPARYRNVGQPVFVPGDMGRYSFVAVGAEGAMRESFGSTCHGAGRVMGRKAAVRKLAGRDIAEELRRAGIIVRAQDRGLLAEEASDAYKDVADVVGICHAAGLSRRVARMRPIGVIKG
ncbi:MAG: intein-containing RctB family protein [Armatimonadota bacterium]